jgi:protocatechuate 3,4-dioxygenase beta subunit
MSTELNRRQALSAFGTVSLGALLAACSGDGEDAASTGGSATDAASTAVEPRPRTTKELAEMFDDAARCTVSTELAEGPYYFDADAIRSDIREGRKGATLRLGIRVRDAERCDPIPNAVVDIWHCDALGVYSGFESASRGAGGSGASGGGSGPSDDERYLRGAQVTGGDGIAEFVTVYPGWYEGRTVHIHAKAHLDRQTLLTTQLFFDDRVSAEVHRRKPYSSRGEMGVPNDADGIFDDSLVLTTSKDGDRYLGVITLDVERA